ncbi:hypothetical protein NQZ68_008360 [Dissostichus eleginoides]|nr:hypothetical protein NQZ68_008360 [Dissostichus eleginoides]
MSAFIHSSAELQYSGEELQKCVSASSDRPVLQLLMEDPLAPSQDDTDKQLHMDKVHFSINEHYREALQSADMM